MTTVLESTLRACRQCASRVLVTSAGLLLIGPPDGRAATGDAPCPGTVVQHYLSNGSITTGAAAYDSSYTGLWPSHIAFDHGSGRVHLDASSGGRAAVFVRVVDLIDVVGVPAGTPVLAVLEFRLDGFSVNDCGSSGCGVEFAATLSSGVDSVMTEASGQSEGRRDLATLLALPVSLVAGSPIQAQCYIVYSTGPGGSASAQVTGHYGVSGTPSGVSAISCASGDVTPIRHGTWGALKLRYH